MLELILNESHGESNGKNAMDLPQNAFGSMTIL